MAKTRVARGGNVASRAARLRADRAGPGCRAAAAQHPAKAAGTRQRPESDVVVSEPRALNGSGNNPQHPEWGEAGSRYVRLAPPNYADGISQPVTGPNPRYISNRVFNSLGVDLFSPRNVSQWVWVWGQFLDHNFELAEGGSEEMPISVNQNDPLESFSDTLGMIPFVRDAPAPGLGHEHRKPPPADQHGSLLHRRLCRLRGNAVAAGMAAHGTRRRQPRRSRPDADAARRLSAGRRRPRRRRPPPRR